MRASRIKIKANVVFGRTPYIKVCKRNDPNLIDCIKDSIENLRPKLKTGIPELEVPGLEPLHLREINVTPVQNARLPRFKALGHNVDARGVSDFKIHKIEADLDSNTFRASIEIPVIKFNGEYEVNVNVLALPIKTRGPMTGNTTDVYGEATLQGHIETRNGQRYIKFDKMDVDVALSNYHIYLGNLFGNDPVLSESVNQAINANNKEFIKVIKPIIDATASNMLLEVANRITEHFTYDQLFPAN
ncbi:Putative beta-carotene-binding protein [Frankliniella fusca]|uniref:Beta-carotene-binding protein n=1 Tax=Frankliniella fusca TaxID=407009 RepID=A0AAE1LBD0_9NEOP|nr:Putative beta-carotene-binding protein [Frankliniella fusca]